MKNFISILLLLTTINISAQNAGSSGLSFLKLGLGGRNLAMGDIGNVISEDLSALYYNPSKLALKSDNEVIINHNVWIEDISSQMFGIKTSILGIPIAVGLNVTNISDIEIRTRPGEPQAKFDANYFCGSISSAYKFSDELSFGATIKYLYEGMLNDEATGFGFDFGVNYLTPIENLSLSAAIRNLGTMDALRNQSTNLPSDFRIGSQYKFKFSDYNIDLVLAGEYQKYFESDSHINLGLEITYNKILALRSGYQTNYEIRDFTAGFGLVWSNLRFDYAFIPFKFGIGSRNIFSLAFSF